MSDEGLHGGAKDDVDVPPVDGKHAKGVKLPPSLAAKVFDSIRHMVPEWLQGSLEENERGVILLERQIQRRFINEYRAQVKAVEPVLRARGFALGEAIKEAFLGHQKSQTTYKDAEEGAYTSLFDSPKTKEILDAVDPLISPVMGPFVEGIQEPINLALKDIQKDVTRAFIYTSATAFFGGLILGRISSRLGTKKE